MPDRPIRVLFLCLGNICRSPLAEGVFAHEATRRGLAGTFEWDSAGTSAYHAGELPDPGSIAVARQRGLDITDQRSRPLRREDFTEFDFIIPMDRSNRRNLQRAGDIEDARCPLIREFDPDALHDYDVPDPYGGGANGFEVVYEMLARSMDGLMVHMQHHGRRN